MYNYDLEKTAAIIRELREEKKVTQEQAANDMGINIKTYRASEQASRGMSIDTFCLFANYYGVSVEYLLTGKKSEDDLSKVLEQIPEEHRSQLLEMCLSNAKILGWM